MLFDNCSFIVLSEVWEGYASYFVLFLQGCFGNSGSFMVPYIYIYMCVCIYICMCVYMYVCVYIYVCVCVYIYKDYSGSVKNIMSNMIRIALNL